MTPVSGSFGPHGTSAVIAVDVGLSKGRVGPRGDSPEEPPGPWTLDYKPYKPYIDPKLIESLAKHAQDPTSPIQPVRIQLAKT